MNRPHECSSLSISVLPLKHLISWQKKRDAQSSNAEENEGGMDLMEIGAERTKNVLILMSDRASAEAIRDAFQIEFGDEYKIVWEKAMPTLRAQVFGRILILKAGELTGLLISGLGSLKDIASENVSRTPSCC